VAARGGCKGKEGAQGSLFFLLGKFARPEVPVIFAVGLGSRSNRLARRLVVHRLHDVDNPIDR